MKKMLMRIISFIMILSITFSFLTFFASADETGYLSGTVNGTSVNVRTGPGTNYPYVYSSTGVHIQVNTGLQLQLENNKYADQNGQSYFWYKATFTYNSESITGFICADYVTVQVPDSPSDPITPPPILPPEDIENFETQIAGFPDDYKALLRNVHTLHPNWRFVPFNTNLDWNYVQQNENLLRRSLTSSKITSHRSMEQGCYDWLSDTFIPMESTNWFQASPELIAYYMDPRNFLKEDTIFQFEKLSFDPSTQTLEAIQSMLVGSFMETNITINNSGVIVSYAQAFYDAAVTYQISAFHLVSRCIQEIGRSGNALGSCGNYPGYESIYNFFNIGAYNGGEAGLQYAKNQGWNTAYKSIMGGAATLTNGYISVGQDTLYYQKFNVVNGKFYHQYMTNVAAPLNEGITMRNGYISNGLIESAFTFSIPVFLNMPQNVCACPNKNGSPNNLLCSIAVQGYDITPTFQIYQDPYYSLIINDPVSSINVSAQAISSKATVTGTGNIPISYGTNVIDIVCYAENGDPRYYYLTVVSNYQGEPQYPEASGFSTDYTIKDSVIKDIPLGTSANEFIAKLGLYGKATASVIDHNGDTVAGNEIMCSGYTLILYDGTKRCNYTLMIYGDADGNGSVDMSDIVLLRQYISALDYSTGISSVYTEFGGDADNNGTIDMSDIVLLRQYIANYDYSANTSSVKLG